MPGAIGGAGWGGGAFDPSIGNDLHQGDESAGAVQDRSTRRARIRSTPTTRPTCRRRALRVAMPSRDSGAASFRRCRSTSRRTARSSAIDLNTGDTKWTSRSATRRRFAIIRCSKISNLPPLGVAGSPGPIVTASGLIFVTGGGSTLYAIDSRRTDATLWSADLGQSGYAVPMTYRTKAGKQFVVIATGAATGAKLMAFALP